MFFIFIQSRGNDIFGVSDSQHGLDNLPYATLSYANGPGYKNNLKADGDRQDLKNVNMRDSVSI